MFHPGKGENKSSGRKDVLAKQLLRSAREYFTSLIDTKYHSKDIYRRERRKQKKLSHDQPRKSQESEDDIKYFKYCDLLVNDMWHQDFLDANFIDKEQLANHIGGLVQSKQDIDTKDDQNPDGAEIGEYEFPL